MSSGKTIKRFLEPVKKEWKSVLHASLHDGITALLLTLFIYFSQYAIAALEQDNQELFYKRCRSLLILATVLLCVKIIRKPYIFTFFRNLWQAVDEICMPLLIYGDNNRFESYGTGRIISIYRKGVVTRVDTIASVFGDFVQSLVLFGAFLYTVTQSGGNFVSVVIGVLCFVFVWFYFVGPKQYVRRKVAKEKSIEGDRLEAKRFMSKYEILQQDKILLELQKRKNIRQEWYRAKFKEKVYQGIAFDGAGFFVMILYAALVYVIGKKVFSGELQYSDMIAITGIGVLFIKELDGLLRLVRIVLDRRIDVRKLRDLIDEVNSNKRSVTEGKHITVDRGNITAHNIVYAYPDGTRVFDAFSVTLVGKQKTALVGPSGGGKSTLIKLIAGYLQPDSGQIIVDGQDLGETNLLSYYKHVGYLTQEPSVFDGTIRENLEYGFSSQSVIASKSKQAIETIIPLAKCERIYNLPHGLDTEIGERGIRLSGGQKQRLAIAKIMLKNPDIILLDEPTSALDSANEQAVTEALNNLFQDKTVIIIAHRLQTVKHADDIIYIADGKVIERGTHDELFALGGEYYQMVELQSGF